MRSARRASVRTSLTLAVLITVALSWIIGGGVANYVNYLNLRALHRQMEQAGGRGREWFEQPRFGIVEFITGRPPRKGGDWDRPGGDGPEPPPDIPGAFEPPDRPDSPTRHEDPMMRVLAIRALIALGLAALAGGWLGRRFTKPLGELSKGAEAFTASDFSYRIPVQGSNEFAQVAASMNEMAERVSEQIGELQDDALRRRQLLADIAHELRSPVAAIQTMAGAMQDGVASDASRREFAVSSLASSSRQLARLVTDLMDLAKLDLKELAMQIGPVDAREVAAAAVDGHLELAREAGVTLTGPDDGAPVMALADADRVCQILNNLIENAISYAGEGAAVRVEVSGDDPVAITVSDNGKGISERDLPFVTDPFFRADSARTPQGEHSGLGLSIASRLAEAQGGKLTIDSSPGRGVTAILRIPASE